MSECIFCKIVKGEVPSMKIYEDGIDAWPKFNGSTMTNNEMFERLRIC